MFPAELTPWNKAEGDASVENAGVHEVKQVEVQPGEVVVVVNPEKLAVQNRIQMGARWFRTIGFFAVVNSLLVLTHAPIRFIFALGITYLASAVAQVSDLGLGGEAGALIFALLGCAGCYFFARYAARGFAWAFVAGMALYTLDGLVFVLVKDWLEVACHAYALYGMYAGLQAAQEYRRKFAR